MEMVIFMGAGASEVSSVSSAEVASASEEFSSAGGAFGSGLEMIIVYVTEAASGSGAK